MHEPVLKSRVLGALKPSCPETGLWEIDQCSDLPPKQMELPLCQESRLAIELDGMQHFTDLDAYRRDRRKDALLQENGYFVLRFLTEDVSKRLDEVLDSINRTLIHRRGPNPTLQCFHPVGIGS
jgi:Protein of unknown function (DUF559)